MLTVVRTDRAETDLVEILDYLEERNPQAAARLATAIDGRCTLLGQLPEMGRTREELGPAVRSVVIEQYVLFYRVTATAVEVLRILHGAGDIDTIMRMD
jgi:toxin ParE1/3/4